MIGARYLAVLFWIALFFGCITLPPFPETGDNKTNVTPSVNESSNGAGIPNPASVYCTNNGGRLNIVQEATGEYGVCEFPNGGKCEEWAYYNGECTPEGPNYCVTDADCACGTHIISGECFVGSKQFVNVERQCPDYCTGIGGMFETKCVKHRCQIVRKKETKIGDECDSTADCQNGADCYVLPGYEKPRCYMGDPCELCPSNKKCILSTSFPTIVRCVEENSQEGFCGWSTEAECTRDDDCMRGGCNSQICQARSEGIIMSSCDKPCYRPEPYGLRCGCVEGKCKWH
ncbi:MAG: DUF333 domain-containing protein [Candidatus Bilamarchaeaceae archaeon]